MNAIGNRPGLKTNPQKGKKEMKTWPLLLTFAVVTLTGCVSTTTGTKVGRAKIAQIEKGETTGTEVVALLGPPLDTTHVPGGKRQMNYRYWHIVYSPIGYNQMSMNPLMFLPFADEFGRAMGRGKSHFEYQDVTITVGPNDVVENVRVNEGVGKDPGW